MPAIKSPLGPRNGIKAFLVLFSVCSPGFSQPTVQNEQLIKWIDQPTTATRLEAVIRHLSVAIGERNLSRPAALRAADDYIGKSLEAMQYKVDRQAFSVLGRECNNLIAEVAGTSNPTELLIVGAHYDSASGSPGANDNGSGVAALLEIARNLRAKHFSKTVRFVAFANEEPPYFQQEGEMGSWVYAKACRARDDDIKLVLSLETMGYYSDKPDSQKYPAPLAALYPSTGNFIGFVSNIESRPQLTETVKSFRRHCKVDAQLGAMPAELKGVGWSDHWSFWQEGYPGIMVTDTAPFRYPHYHLASDTVDKIEFGRYSQVVDGLANAISDLANAEKR